MGSTPERVNRFEEWLRARLIPRHWRIADLAREIARQEGISERDAVDFKRRSKAIQNNFSNVFSGASNLGFEYAAKIAAALEVKPEEVMEVAGLLERNKTTQTRSAKPEKSPARQKIEALLDMLDRQEQETAIAILEAFTEDRKKAKKAAADRGLKRT